MNHSPLNNSPCLSLPEKIALWLVVFCSLVLSIASTTTTLLLLACLIAFFSGNLYERLLTWRRYPVIWCYLALILWIWISTTYSALPFHTAASSAWKQTDKLLIAALLIPLCRFEHWRQRIILSFIAGTLLCITYLTLFHFGLIKSAKYFVIPSSIHWIRPQNFSVVSAITAILCLQQFHKPKIIHHSPIIKTLWLLAFLYCAYFTYFINPEKIGPLVFLALVPLYLFYYQKKHYWKFIIGILIAIGLFFSFSPSSLKVRYQKAASAIITANPQASGSVYARLKSYQYTWASIQKRPLTGYGTNYLFNKKAAPFGLRSPEDTYLNVWLRYGLVGLLLLLAWLYLQWQTAGKLPLKYKFLLQLFVLAFFIECLTSPRFQQHFITIRQSLFLAVALGAQLEVYLHKLKIKKINQENLK